ncbi:REP-associated tyrosine transposase [Spirosoma montaniterrae]|uniref:Transposase IS200-like domain-containing protein n=1 Tax=Spirosoma montaniterrae TaxID=1178516 RepID=A0A1P9WZK8_9BACT|nr:transposase [Spirosoma montaniterrae]AQG80816.1 hypothetical protein AWR27_16725 [Spirosoma montaniterrae]
MPPGETLFITYRLFNTLPYTVLQGLKHEHASFLKIQQLKSPDLNEKELQSTWEGRYFQRVDAFIDQNSESKQWLSETAVAQIVEESIRYRNGKHFALHAYCVMPNHVHLLVTNEQTDMPFHRVLGSMKANSAKAINLHLNRVGQPVWATESYDHVVRNGKSFERIISYIIHNPVKAGLVMKWQDWPHTHCQYDWS